MSTKPPSHQRVRWFDLDVPAGLEVEFTVADRKPMLRLRLTVDQASAIARQLYTQCDVDRDVVASHHERELFLGAEFMTARARAGIRFEEAVARTGLSRSLLRDLECGRIRPRYGSEVYKEIRAAIESFSAVPTLREVSQ